MRVVIAGLLLMTVAACGAGKPAHYYVMCSATDPNEWKLVRTETDPSGDYIIACTYQSPDERQTYIVRCTDEGCD